MASAALKTTTKKKKKRSSSRSLGELSFDEFLSTCVPSDSEEEEEHTKEDPPSKRSKSGHKEELSRLAVVDPEFFQYLQENDQDLLRFSDSEPSGEDDSNDGENMGETEPVPEHITSRKKKPIVSRDTGESDSEGDDGGGERGTLVTLHMIQQWVNKITKSHSLPALHQLTLALHTAVARIQSSTKEEEEEEDMMEYRVDGTAEFNKLVISCLKHIPGILTHHIPLEQRGRRPSLPSSHKNWSKVKQIMRPYLSDLLRMLNGLRDASMQCAVLRHIQVLVPYYASFPKLQRSLTKTLISEWANGEHHVQVVAFLILRRTTLLQPHPSLHRTLKCYGVENDLSIVETSKFTSAKTLPQIRFKQNCLVELLAIDPLITYQHGFIYIRQLALHLRTAITSGKKDSQQAVYNWQFIHCLDLWAMVLGQVRNDSLLPLVYPLVQVTMGTIQLQPSARFYPLRLHCVESLLQLASATNTFIPLAPLLLEVLESEGGSVSSSLNTGKPPDLTCLLKVSKQQQQSRSFQSAILNKSFELLLLFFSDHTHCIGFPELTFPAIIRMRKVAKVTPLSWFRNQLKQLIEKVDEVGGEVTRERSKANFSPKDTDQIAAWESCRRAQENAVSRFLATWRKVHRQMPEKTLETEKKEAKEEKTIEPVVQEPADKSDQSDDGMEGSDQSDDGMEMSDQSDDSKSSNQSDSAEEGEDIVRDFQFSSESETD